MRLTAPIIPFLMRSRFHVSPALVVAACLAPRPAFSAGPGEIHVQLGKDSEASAEEPAVPDPTQRDKPWIRRFAPQRNMAEVGIYGGVFFASENHDFYDPNAPLNTTPQKPLWRASADIGLRVAFYPVEYLGLELEGNVIPARVRTVNDDFALLYGFRAHPVLQLPWYRITPFVLGGFGAMGVRSNVFVLGNDVDPVAHYGGGVKMFLNRWLAVRVEARHLMGAQAALQNDVTHHVEVHGGLSVTLRPKPKRPEPPNPDRDDDGFLNEVDACPDTPGIEPDGCPAHDSDGDGFLDPDDKCPTEPGVAADGCPIPDSDGDGILDPDDKCPTKPETKNGYEDEDGCPDEIPAPIKEFTGVIDGIEFEFNKTKIRKGSKPTLDKAVKVLKEFPEIRVEISGHTDNVGTREFNVDLSRRRAEAVRDYLVAGGVAAERLKVRGAGPDQPIADNETEGGRAKNRRTEFRILVKKTATPAGGTKQ